MRQQQFDGHVAPEPLVPRPPHLTHAAGAQALLDGVGADAVARLYAPPLAGNLERKDIERRHGKEVTRLRLGRYQRRELGRA